MHRLGMLAVSVVLLLQSVVAASMPVMPVSANNDVVVICTGMGMKTMLLSDLGIELDQDQPDSGTAVPGGMCVLCSFAHGAAIMPSVAFVPAIDLDTHAPQAPPRRQTLSDGFPRVQQARAPPFPA